MVRVSSPVVPGGPGFKVVAADHIAETETAKVMTAGERVTTGNVAARDAITHVTAYAPIYFALDGRHGVPAYSWIVPKNLRYLATNTPVTTIANSVSGLTDPLGKLSTLATDYCVLAADSGDWTLYLDPADNTVKTVKATALAVPANCITLATVRGVQGTIQARSGVPAYVLGRELFDAPRLFYHGPVFWDGQSKTLYVPKMTAQWPSSGASKSNTPPSGYYSKSLSATAQRKLFFDLAVADGSDPLVVADNNDGAPRSTSLVEIGHAVDWNFVFAGETPAMFQLTNQPDKRVKNIAPYKPVYFVKSGEFGITGGDYLMVPKLFRYVIEHPANVITNVDSLANSLSAFVDPGGTYNWAADYVGIALPQNAENYVYIDVGDNTLKTNSRASRPRSTGAAGIIPIGMIHRVGDTITSGAVPIYRASVGTEKVLSARIDSAEGRLDALEGAGASVISVISDGYKLRRSRVRLAGIRLGSPNPPKRTALLADSWGDRNQVSTYVAQRYTEDGVATSATGWFSVSGLVMHGGMALTKGADWTAYDGSADQAEANVSPDGNILISTAAGGQAAQQLNFTGIKGDTIYLSYKDADGTFRYRVNAGAWQTVACANSGGGIEVQIATGLSTSGTHSLDIDLTGNTGTVGIAGAYAKSSVTGIEWSKMGNSGVTTAQWQNWLDATIRVLSLIEPDEVVILMGTNNQRLGLAPADYKTDLQAMITAIHDDIPSCGIVLLAPPRSSTEGNPGTSSYQQFGDKVRELAAENDFVEFVDYSRLWGPCSEEQYSANGMYNNTDGYHLNGAIAHRRFVGDYYDTMVRPYLAK